VKQRIPGAFVHGWRHGVLTVHPFQSKSPNLVPVEHRIPVKDLTDKYAEQVRKLLSSGLGRVNDMIGPKDVDAVEVPEPQNRKQSIGGPCGFCDADGRSRGGDGGDRSLIDEPPHIGNV